MAIELALCFEVGVSRCNNDSPLRWVNYLLSATSS